MNLHPSVRPLSLWSLLLLAVVLALPAPAPAAGLRKIGGGTTDIAIFVDGAIKHTSVLSLGATLATSSNISLPVGSPDKLPSAARFFSSQILAPLLAGFRG